MAKNMKTIKFGENGETYAVNAPVVSVIGELAEDSQYIDFGTFEGGLTELECYVEATGESDDSYVIPVINGMETKFVTAPGFYDSNGNYIRIKKIGGLWTGLCQSNGNFVDTFPTDNMKAISSADKITSFAIKAYSGGTFSAGTKYVLEGR